MTNSERRLRRALVAATRELSRTWPLKGKAAVARQRLIRLCEKALKG